MNVIMPKKIESIVQTVGYDDMDCNIVYSFGDRILASELEESRSIIAIDRFDSEVRAFSDCDDFGSWLEELDVPSSGVPTNLKFDLVVNNPSK